MERVSPALAPSQGCKQETTSAGMTGRRHEDRRHGRSFPSSRSLSGMRAGDDIRRDDGATARGWAPWTKFPLAPSQRCEQETTNDWATGRRHEAGRHGRSFLSLPVRDASKRRHMTGRRHEAGRHGSVPLLSLPVRDASRRLRWWYQPEVGRELGTGTTKSEECIRPGRPSEGSLVNSFPRIELGAPQ